jgi:hypothetical protein
MLMDLWRFIFSQSKVNNGLYDGDSLPDRHWVWPEQTWFQKRRSCLRKAATSNRGSRPDKKRKERKEGQPLSNLSVVPLLIVEEEIPAEARRALVENRPLDAAQLLVQEYGLSCKEAGDLLDVSACQDA